MVSAKQYLVNVWDENGVKSHVSLSSGDLVMIISREREKPVIGIFRGFAKHTDSDLRSAMLEVPDRIAGYDRRVLQTKQIRIEPENIDHIRILARASSAVGILFQEIGTALATATDLKARIKKATEVLNSQ